MTTASKSTGKALLSKPENIEAAHQAINIWQKITIFFGTALLTGAIAWFTVGNRVIANTYAISELKSDVTEIKTDVKVLLGIRMPK